MELKLHVQIYRSIFLKKDTTGKHSKCFILVVIDKKHESSSDSNRSLISFPINSNFKFQSGPESWEMYLIILKK